MGRRKPERTLARARRRRDRRRHVHDRREPGIPGDPRWSFGRLYSRQGRQSPGYPDWTPRGHEPPDHLHARRQAVRGAGGRNRSVLLRSPGRGSSAASYAGRRPGSSGGSSGSSTSGSSTSGSSTSGRCRRPGTRGRTPGWGRTPTRIPSTWPPGDAEVTGVRAGRQGSAPCGSGPGPSKVVLVGRPS